MIKINIPLPGYQTQLPNYMANGDSLLGKRNSVPNLFRQHIKQTSQLNWKYNLFAFIMEPLAKSFEEKVSPMNCADTVTTSSEWVLEKMSITELRKNIYERLVTLCTDTNIIEDPSKMREEIQKLYDQQQENKVPDENFAQEKILYGDEKKRRFQGSVVFSVSSLANTNHGDSKHRKIHQGVIFPVQQNSGSKYP